MLSRLWTLAGPGYAAPADIAASILLDRLFFTQNDGFDIRSADNRQDIKQQQEEEILVVDFCSGAGGPTPAIEKAVNQGRRVSGMQEARFLMTDLIPNVPAWENAVSDSGSRNLGFVTESVDATDPPQDLMSISSIHLSGRSTALDSLDSGASQATRARAANGQDLKKKVFRTFCLSFHHFTDPVARRVLVNAMATSDGFAIVELQDRRLFTMLFISMNWLVAFAMSWFWFWRDWRQLFLTYVIPVLPAVLWFDGQVSALRVREFHEILNLINDGTGDGVVEEVLDRGEVILRARKVGWVFESGKRKFMPLYGANVIWIIGRRS